MADMTVRRLSNGDLVLRSEGVPAVTVARPRRGRPALVEAITDEMSAERATRFALLATEAARIAQALDEEALPCGCNEDEFCEQCDAALEEAVA